MESANSTSLKQLTTKFTDDKKSYDVSMTLKTDSLLFQVISNDPFKEYEQDVALDTLKSNKAFYLIDTIEEAFDFLSDYVEKNNYSIINEQNKLSFIFEMVVLKKNLKFSLELNEIIRNTSDSILNHILLDIKQIKEELKFLKLENENLNKINKEFSKEIENLNMKNDNLNNQIIKNNISINGADSLLSCSTKFIVNGISIEGSINYTYNMTDATVYSLDFSNSLWNIIKVQLYGAGGGHNKGGSGGYVEGLISLSKIPAKKFWIVVGGAGSAKNITNSGTLYTTGGYNGGGRGVTNNVEGTNTGGGGGATDVRLIWTFTTDYANSQRILIAGGGGGGTNNSSEDCKGGDAGFPYAQNIIDKGYGGADGGSQFNGAGLGTGGENINNNGWNGGGGGGYYGGGSCKKQHGGGAGGSGYYDPSYISSFSCSTSGGGSAAQTDGKAVLTIIS
jgi:hypothetical protein